ncbi:MAG: hypothetical protein V3U37_07730 [Nitrospinaceae bacterium]
MFHEVKIFNSSGEIKKVIPSRELSKLHWDNFQRAEDSISLTTSGATRIPRWVKERLDIEYPELREAGVAS